MARNVMALLIAGSATGIPAAESAGAVAGPRSVAIEFSLQAGDTPLGCKTAAVPLGKPPVATRLRDARWYVYDLALINKQGKKVPLQLDQNEWQYLSVALVDLEEGGPAPSTCTGGTPATHSKVTGRIPAGDYVGLSFGVGVPVSAKDSAGKTVQLNHSSTTQAPPPLDLTALSWVWQAGRRFMKIELEPAGGVARKSGTSRVWILHLGSTGCTGEPVRGEIVTCSEENRFGVQLERFDPAQDKVVLDLAQLVRGMNLGRDEDGSPGCMSGPPDPECDTLYQHLGLTSGAPAQTVFRASRR